MCTCNYRKNLLRVQRIVQQLSHRLNTEKMDVFGRNHNYARRDPPSRTYKSTTIIVRTWLKTLLPTLVRLCLLGNKRVYSQTVELSPTENPLQIKKENGHDLYYRYNPTWMETSASTTRIVVSPNLSRGPVRLRLKGRSRSHRVVDQNEP